jgi:hypothetical protein
VGKDNDGDPITTNVVEWLPVETLAGDGDDPRAPVDPWIEGLRQEQRTAALRLKRILYELLASQAIEAPVTEDGALVRMVPQRAVQAAFFDRTAEDEDQPKTRQGKHQRFSRARDLAEERQLIDIGQVEGKTHLWLCQPAEEETQ